MIRLAFLLKLPAFAAIFIPALASAYPRNALAIDSADRSCVISALASELKAPGTVAIENAYLTNPADLAYMRLSSGEASRIGVHMAEELLGHELSASQAEQVGQVCSKIFGARAKEDSSKAVKTLSLILADAGVDEPLLRAQFAQSVATKTELLKNHSAPISATAAQAAELRREAQSELISALDSKKIPYYPLHVSEGIDIPVVLVNKTTFPDLKALMENRLQFGDGVKLFPSNGDTDHGVIRVGQRLEDYYFPGEVTGDVHQIGLGGKAIGPLMQWSSGQNPIVELAYALSADETQVVRSYHAVRRGGIFRVRNKWAPDKPGYQGKTAVLERGHELCYTFGTGICSIEHSRNMHDYLMRMGVSNPDRLLERPEVKSYLREAYRKLEELPLDSPEAVNDPNEQEKILHDWILYQTPRFHQLLGGLMPERIQGAEDQVRFFNYLLGIDVSRKYAAVMKDLEFFDPETALIPMNQRDVSDRNIWPLFAQATKKRAAALFVYDNRVQTLDDFRSKTYSGAYYRMKPGESPVRRENW